MGEDGGYLEASRATNVHEETVGTLRTNEIEREKRKWNREKKEEKRIQKKIEKRMVRMEMRRTMGYLNQHIQ